MARHTEQERARAAALKAQADLPASCFVRSPRDTRAFTDRLADQYGLPSERLAPIVARLSQSGDPECLCFHSAALNHSASEALALFEQTDPQLLLTRAQMFAEVLSPWTPLATLDELGEVLEAYARYRTLNRDMLVRTGYPSVGFAPFPWVDWHVVPMLPTRLPLSVYRHPERTAAHPVQRHEVSDLVARDWLPKDEFGNRVYTYTWSRDPDELLRSQVKPCRYEEAPLIYGLTAYRARMLEYLRPRFLETVVQVLHICSRHIKSRNSRDLWPTILNSLLSAFSSDELWVLDWADGLYSHIALNCQLLKRYGPFVEPHYGSGLAGLLLLVGHCESELIHGALNRVAPSLHRVRGKLGWLGDVERLLGARKWVPSLYFVAYRNTPRELLDEMLDTLLTDLRASNRFWAEYEARVNRDLNDAASTREFTYSVRLHEPDAEVLEPFLRGFNDATVAYYGRTGTLPVISPDSRTPSDSTTRRQDAYVFRLSGEKWEVAYEGSRFYVNDTLGMRYLARLLADPHRQFDVLDLEGSTAGAAASTSAIIQDGHSGRAGGPRPRRDL
jgi:hypothetical protein